MIYEQNNRSSSRSGLCEVLDCGATFLMHVVKRVLCLHQAAHDQTAARIHKVRV